MFEGVSSMPVKIIILSIVIGLVAGLLGALCGVGGGIVAVVPGQFTVCVWSPELNAAGNSLAGMAAHPADRLRGNA